MAFQKGHPQYGHSIKGTKYKPTILKEERQAIFDAKVSQEFESLIDQARPEYKLDRFMGKVPDEVNVNTKMIKVQLSADLTKSLEEEMKSKLLDGTK